MLGSYPGAEPKFMVEDAAVAAAAVFNCDADESIAGSGFFGLGPGFFRGTLGSRGFFGPRFFFSVSVGAVAGGMLPSGIIPGIVVFSGIFPAVPGGAAAAGGGAMPCMC